MLVIFFLTLNELKSWWGVSIYPIFCLHNSSKRVWKWSKLRKVLSKLLWWLKYSILVLTESTIYFFLFQWKKKGGGVCRFLSSCVCCLANSWVKELTCASEKNISEHKIVAQQTSDRLKEAPFSFYPIAAWKPCVREKGTKQINN